MYCIRYLFLPAYSATAPATKSMQERSQMEMEVMPEQVRSKIGSIYQDYNLPSTVGDTVLMVLNMLVSTRKRVTSNPILPGTTEGEIRKLTQDT